MVTVDSEGIVVEDSDGVTGEGIEVCSNKSSANTVGTAGYKSEVSIRKSCEGSRVFT